MLVLVVCWLLFSDISCLSDLLFKLYFALNILFFAAFDIEVVVVVLCWCVVVGVGCPLVMYCLSDLLLKLNSLIIIDICCC